MQKVNNEANFIFWSSPDIKKWTCTCTQVPILLYSCFSPIYRMDWICQKHLNRGFRAAEQFHAKCLKQVRAKLPRRESSRREHPYSRHCDILTAIGTRFV